MNSVMLKRYSNGVTSLSHEIVSYIEQRYKQNDAYKVQIARDAQRKFKVKVLPEYIGALAELHGWPKRETRTGKKGGKPKNYIHVVGVKI